MCLRLLFFVVVAAVLGVEGPHRRPFASTASSLFEQFCPSTDSRHHFRTPELSRLYQNRETTKDSFMGGWAVALPLELPQYQYGAFVPLVFAIHKIEPHTD